MNPELCPEVLAAAQFLQAQVNANPYGSVGVTLTSHAGKISKIEKSIITTAKPENRGTYDKRR